MQLFDTILPALRAGAMAALPGFATNPPPSSPIFESQDPRGDFEKSVAGWDFYKLGVKSGETVHTLYGENHRLVGGQNGVIYFRRPNLEAVGLCFRGAREDVSDLPNINEDSIGQCSSKLGIFFHLADGMGGHGHGEVASKGIIDGMMLFTGEGEIPLFDRELHPDVHEFMKSRSVEGKTGSCGSTYMGLMLGAMEAVNYFAYAGDSRAMTVDAGVLSYLSEAHFFNYEAIRRHPYREVMSLVRERSKDAANFFDSLRMKWKLPDVRVLRPGKGMSRKQKKEFYARLLFELVAAPSAIARCFKANYGPPLLDVDRVSIPRSGSGRLHALYSDGVGDVRSPFDVMHAFSDNSLPLYVLAERFALEVMSAQTVEAKVSMGLGKPIKVRSKKDNFSLWVVREK